MLIVAVLLAVPPATAGSWDFLQPEAPPTPATYAGAFDRAPVFQYRTRLPGPPINAASHAEWSAPVLHEGLIFVGSAAGEALYALARRDGAMVATYPALASVEASAVVVGDRVYFSDTGGNTFCYTIDGERQWMHDGTAPVLVAPAVSPDGDLVVVTNVDDLAVALSAATGELQWQYRARRDLTRQAELSLYAAPQALIVDDQVILGFSNGTVVSVELETGEEQWQRGVGEGRYPDVVADPVAAGTDLFSSGYYRPLVALDLPSHNVRWRVEAGAAHPVAVEERDGAVVIYHPGTDGRLLAVAGLTGAQLWMWDSKTSGALTTPRITEAGLLVASSEGGLYLIDPVTGEELWRWHESWQLRGISAVPAVDGRQVVFVSNAGFLYSMLAPLPSPPHEPPWP